MEPNARVRVGVMGAGAVGCYVGGRLLAADAADVTFIGRQRLRDELAANGMTVREFGDDGRAVAAGDICFELEPAALAACDAVLCCVKSLHTEAVGRELAAVLSPDAIVVSLQNGVRNADVLRGTLGDRAVLAGIVGFNVVWKEGPVFQRTTSGPLTLEASADPRATALVRALAGAGIDVTTRDDIAPDQWTKLLLNLNNAISALSGAPTRDLILVSGYRRIVGAVMREGLAVLDAAGIAPARLRGVPMRWLARMMTLPTLLVRVLARAQMKIDPAARSSMYQDLVRGRLTEVDSLNGEIVALAERASVDAPLNRRIVDLVHEAEAAAGGSPQLSHAALWDALSA